MNRSRLPRPYRFLLAFLGMLLLAGCGVSSPIAVPAATGSPAAPPEEVALTPIPLEGAAAQAQAEYSGLAWYGDTLVLLPQFPETIFSTPDNPQQGSALLGLSRQALLDFLDGDSPTALEPFPIPLETGGLEEDVPGFEGFEAIAFLDDTIYLTIEARRGLRMRGYLVSGEVRADLSAIRLDPASLVELPLPANLLNQSYEALLVAGRDILAFYEVNDARFTPQPQALRFDAALQSQDSLPFPHLPYRVTDAGTLDARDRFWVINAFYPRDFRLRTDLDELAVQFGRGPTHAENRSVERLVELQYSQDVITLTGAPPVQLQLLPGESRNWEGLARLDERGFLLVTDKFPETIFGFLPTE